MTDYTTLSQIKAILDSQGLPTDTVDDAVITQFITAASTYFDEATGKTFVSSSATRYYDCPIGSSDLVVDDFTSLTSITNGDGTSIPTGEVQTLPLNSTPKYIIHIKGSSTCAWTLPTTGDPTGAIAVVADWGQSATCPAQVRTAVEAFVVSLYQSKRGNNTQGSATITGAGLVITPRDVPDFTAQIIRHYASKL